MTNDLVVVGLGSSAGGLEALQTMLEKLPQIPNCAYIIAQHLSPTHKSMMVELLSRSTHLAVIEAKNGLRITPKTIYVTPENTDIYIKNGKIFFKTLEQSFGPRPSVNYFLSSLANEYEHRAIGVILSGTGSDGAYGIRAIKANGGITIAQAPATAKYDGMPLSAINTGKVDLVVPIDKLSTEIETLVDTIDKNIALSIDDRILNQLYRAIFENKGVDFSLYKKNTLIRRIERRLSALKVDNLHEYLKIIESNPDEITNLYHDILIGVTSFFRDKEAFDKITLSIKNIVEKKEQGEEIRFWSIACSTGEEAYSLAILLWEILGDKISKYKIKIFATDIDDEALKIARNGVYSETSFDGVDQAIIKRYFSVQKNHFEIKKSVRELVIFSKHNITSDSPFLRLDLISCRNLLIYFSNSLQNKFFPIVHYALKEHGILFLGKSESVGQHVDLFELVDKTQKIFKAQYTGIKEPPKLYNYSSSYKNDFESTPVKKTKNEQEYLEDQITDALQKVVLSQSVVVNSSYDIVYIKGDIPFLKFQTGKVSHNIFKLLGDELSLDLRGALVKASKSKQTESTPYRSITLFQDVIRYVKAIITPIEDEKNEGLLFVIFFQTEHPHNIKGHIISDGDESEAIEKLTLELDSTKSHLQNVIEELETSYEEMQSLNEELQSSNEELQSSNEELETTNEELQSTNEELQTAYSELKVLYEDKEKRALQLEDLTKKLSFKTEEYRKQKVVTEAILDTVPVAVTQLDEKGEITYANNFALELLGLAAKDITKRTYNSKDWNISTYDGKPYPDDQLPFNLIKKTYEAVYDIQHTIQSGDNLLFLSISGAPLFDEQERFVGAVFCIENQTSQHNLQKDILHYKETIDTSIQSNIQKGDADLFELAIIDMDSKVRNSINELSLVLSTINTQDKTINTKLDTAYTTIQNLSSNLGSTTKRYTQKIKYDKSSLKSEFSYYFELFSSVFENRSIEVTDSLSTKNDITLYTKDAGVVLYTLFSFVLKNCFVSKNNQSINICFENSYKDFIYSYTITISNIDVKTYQKQIEQTYKELEKSLKNLTIDPNKKVLTDSFVLTIPIKGV